MDYRSVPKYQYNVEYTKIPLKSSCYSELCRGKERHGLPKVLEELICHRQRQIFDKYSLNVTHFEELVGFLRSCNPSRRKREKTPDIVTGTPTMFTCKCGWLLFDPCSLSCGHTLCRSCVEEAGFCLICGQTLPGKVSTNVFLANLLSKWFPREYKAASLKKEGKKLLHDKEYTKAVEIFHEALKLTPNDHIALLLRSEAKLNIGLVRESLDDAQLAVKLNSSCGQAYFRLGAVFTAMGHLDEAVNAYQTCLELEPDDVSVFKAVVENLDKLLAPPDPASVASNLSEFPLTDPKSDMPDVLSLREPSVIHSSSSSSSLGHSSVGSDSPDPSVASGEAASSSSSTQQEDHKNTPDRPLSPKPCHSRSGTDDSSLHSNDLNVMINLADMDGGCCSSSDLNQEDNDDSASGFPGSGSGSGCDSDEDAIARPNSKRLRSPSLESTSCQADSKKAKKTQSVDQDLDLDDFECKLCFNLLFQPVTTPCGHVFCKCCLDRCLDHKAVCPNCRASLDGFLVHRKRVVTDIIERTIEKYFPEDFHERKTKHEEHMATLARIGFDDEVEVPIFTCAIVLPTIQCPLHIFEPRYKLMLRECLESGSRKFGMCLEVEHGEFSDVGTILEVRTVRYLEDGRAIIDAVGGTRFSVVSRGMRDGFDTAKVKYFVDEWPSSMTDSETLEFNARYDLVYRQLSNYVSNLHPTERECIFNALGPLPMLDSSPKDYPNGVSWVWWALSALPLNNHAKEVLLRCRSLSERLSSIQRFLRILVRMNKPSLHEDPGHSSSSIMPL